MIGWDPTIDSAYDRELAHCRVLSPPAPEGIDEVYVPDERVVVEDPTEANLVGSLLLCSVGDVEPLHAPVIDLDVEVHLIPSSTPGHSHLYIEKSVPQTKYFALLDALVDAGIVEPGYTAAAKRRGQTHVRKPGVRKEVAA